MKKIYRVYAHMAEVDEWFEDYDSFYVTEQSKEEFIAQLEEDHDGTIIIDEVVEYTVEAVVQLLNLYIE